MLPPYLYRLCSICHSRRSARTLHSWVQDKAHWGPPDAWSCPVMGRDTFLMSYFLGPLCPPSPHLRLHRLRPGCNYEGNYSSIVFPLPLSLLPVCSLQTNYSFVISSFFSPQTISLREKILSSSLLLLSLVIYIMIHDASLLYKQWINLLDYPCMCV